MNCHSQKRTVICGIPIAGMLLACALWLPADRTATAADKDDLRALAGEWKRIKLEINGEVADPDNAAAGIRVTDEKVILLQDGKQIGDGELKLKLVPASTPKLLDVKLPDERVLEGIYKLEGKRWTICLRIDSDVRDRPSTFETKAGSGLAVAIFERVE